MRYSGVAFRGAAPLSNGRLSSPAEHGLLNTANMLSMRGMVESDTTNHLPLSGGVRDRISFAVYRRRRNRFCVPANTSGEYWVKLAEPGQANTVRHVVLPYAKDVISRAYEPDDK